MYIPWGVMKLIAGLCTCYGSDIKPVEGRKKGKGKLLLFVDKIETANKLFDPTRFDGTNFLVKRTFRKTVNELTKKKQVTYHGSAEVVISKYTPIHFEYAHDTQYLRINFYIQRYTLNNFAVDSSLQALMNQEE
jgi:hypothetical protein